MINKPVELGVRNLVWKYSIEIMYEILFISQLLFVLNGLCHPDAPDSSHVKWCLVTTAWRVLRLRMEEKASRYGG
jgi:hypothetical protein